MVFASFFIILRSLGWLSRRKDDGLVDQGKVEQTERFLGIALYQGKQVKKKADGSADGSATWVS